MRIRLSAATAILLALAAFTFQSVSAAPEPQRRSVSAGKQAAKTRTAQKQVSKKTPKKTAEKTVIRKAGNSSKAVSRGAAADKTAIEARRAETQSRIEEVRSSISQKSSVKKKLEVGNQNPTGSAVPPKAAAGEGKIRAHAEEPGKNGARAGK